MARRIPDVDPSEVADLLHAVSHRMRREARHELQPLDITWAQLRALRMLHHHDPGGAHVGVRMSDLADALHVARRSATSLVDELESRGLVTRRHDVADRRSVRVEVTAKGTELVREIARRRQQAAGRVLGQLPAGDLLALRDLLAKLAG